MKMKNILSHTKRMLVMAICLCATWQVNAITIKVMKGGTAPHLYTWTGDGSSKVEYSGTWPGTQFSDKDGNDYWTMDVAGANTVNLIFSMDGSPQSLDILNVSGVNGVATFMYDGKTNCFSTMPQLEQSEGFIYFKCPTDFNGIPKAYLWNGNQNNGWPGEEMTLLGQDGAGWRIFKFDCSHLSFTPANVIFNTDRQTDDLNYVANGYYDTSGSLATFHSLTSGNGYTDANFRAGIASQLGISDGNVFAPYYVTYLDVSNCGITSLAGIANFANLQTLIASNNSITCTKTDRTKLNLSNNTNLEILNVNGNNGITSVDIAALTGLSHLEMNNCNINDDQTFSPAGSHNALTYLDMSNNPTEKGFSWHQYLPNLETLIVGGANIRPTGFTQGTNYFSGMSKLKYLDVSNCPLVTSIYLTGAPNLETLILNKNTALQSATATSSGKLIGLNSLAKLKHVEFTDIDLSTSTFIGNLAASKTTLEYLDLSRATLNEPSLSSFTALKTFKAAGNYNLTSGSSKYSLTTLTINNSPELSSIDLTGDQGLVTLNLTNIGRDNNNIDGLFTGLTDCSALEMMNLDGNGFTSVPAFGHNSYTSLKLNKNQLTSIDMSNADLGVQFLYAEENGLGGDIELTATSAGSLKGLDLGNNGFTSFKAEGTALSALMIGDNTSLTTLELHGNNNLTCTTAGTTMSEGSGLYLLGNKNLESINIENSKFNNIGANGSLNGLSKVKTLRASHNEFETFTNSNYDNADSRSKDLATIVGKPSLEHLTGLENLDLSYNLLKDSVHLYRNTQLKRLDVSHNQILGPLPTTPEDRETMITKKLTTCLKYGVTIHGDSTGNHKIGPVGKSVTLTNALRTELTQHDPYRNEDRYADFRPCDLRDTVGLYHLDLYYNTQLEYIDISYTNIHNTAADRKYMNPGWESSPNGWDGWVDTYSPKAEYGPVKHHFILMRGAPNLRVFKADHNNMQSLGTANNHQLDTLSATHMYGDCHFMAGHSYDDYIGYGSKGFNGDNCKIARYIDLSYGSFYSIDPTNLANVEKLIVTGNPLGGGKYPDYVLDVTHNNKLQQLQADTCGNLQTIEAHNLAYLTTLDVTNDTDLRTLRAYDDPVLYNAQTGFITGLPSCSALEELWVSNDNLLELNVQANTNLTTLKCYQNIELEELGLTHNPRLNYLDFHNCKLNDIDLSENTALTYIDCSSPRVAEHLDEDGINKLSDLDIFSKNIQTVIANCNNLYRMTGLNKPSLTLLEFEHNHINGIDLSNTGLTRTTLKDDDNGRTIAADYSIIKVQDDPNSPYDLFFFQLDSLVSNGGLFLGSKSSQDMLKENAYRESLNNDGLVSTQITAWTANAKLLNNSGKNTPIDPNNANNLIDPDKVIGTVVVLDAGHPRAEYTYDTGVSGDPSTYYLDWTEPGVITAVTDIETDNNKPIVTGGTGSITIMAPEGTAIMVYDMAGRLVQQATAGDGEIVIDGMAPGVYIVNGQKVIVK